MKGYLVLEITSKIMCITEFLRAPDTQEPIEISTIEFNTILSFVDSHIISFQFHTSMAPFGSWLFKFQIEE